MKTNYEERFSLIKKKTEEKYYTILKAAYKIQQDEYIPLSSFVKRLNASSSILTYAKEIGLLNNDNVFLREPSIEDAIEIANKSRHYQKKINQKKRLEANGMIIVENTSVNSDKIEGNPENNNSIITRLDKIIELQKELLNCWKNS